MITVNHITIANKSDETPYLSAKAVASDTTTEECTDGIPQLPRALSKFHWFELTLIMSHFKITENKNVTAGIRIMFW